jgi:uncharacterized protein YPO0396
MTTMRKKKLLTRVRLINWHYFRNETLNLTGSTLVSGENTTGKSTVLDAIQLVLTTNTRKFNAAANEKSNRDLKGYVRCKTGNVGETYLRKNSVISNVALEFYEEKAHKYFVIGVHMTSPDEESRINTKWYVEEGRLEALSFITDKKPSLANEFKKNGVKISYIDQIGVAKDRFKRRLGNLEDRFFDIIPKSLAFKPMDNVKDFINKFILPEEKIDVGYLRGSIETLSELEDLMVKSNEKLEHLNLITAKYTEILSKEKEIRVNDLMIRIAEIEAFEEEIQSMRVNLKRDEQLLKSSEQQEKELKDKGDSLNERLIQLNVAKESNETTRLIANAENRIREIKKEIDSLQQKKKALSDEIQKVEKLLVLFNVENQKIVSREQLFGILEDNSVGEKSEVVSLLEDKVKELIEYYRNVNFELSSREKEIDMLVKGLTIKIKNLNQKAFSFPTNTQLLKEAIEKEFIRQDISTKVWVVSELLEVTDPLWQNAVEAYFNNRKFNIIVEPEYFDKALQVYNKMRDTVHSVGLVNTKKLKFEYEINTASLAYIVNSKNRYAKAYANYILGRVIRCDEIKELENHKIAITPQCMVYQGYVVRNLDKNTYKDPFIGAGAFEIQIKNAKAELEQKENEKKNISSRRTILENILKQYEECDIRLIRNNMEVPVILERQDVLLKEEKCELEKAKKDPNFIQLTTQINECKEQKRKVDNQYTSLLEKKGGLAANIAQTKKEIESQGHLIDVKREELNGLFVEHIEEKEDAINKFNTNRKTKSAKIIVDRFKPRKARYENEKETLLYGKGGLVSLQETFNNKYTLDFIRGLDGMQDYFDAKFTLKSAELVRFEEDLRKAKENCEQIFRVSFLAKMKENIESAKIEFRNLNRALQDIYYGEDSYHFEITYDKKKESLYRMITADNNMEGYNLWSAAFEEEYREEMSDLFAKLIAKDDKGENVLAEYTDYRSYLDYDIEVRKKNGKVQRFSTIYGEKSGGETQTPYYVAIAASFYQLYKLDNTIRIILLDEAFDKMDDNRIASMMEFFNSLELQVILATPPAKVEVIGEKVNTILMTIRVNDKSIIEEYTL